MPYLACMSKARPSRVREAHLDWLVITAASRAQAAAYQIEIDRRVREELLPKGCQIAIVPDAHDRRIGSGGATIAALAHLRNMFVQRGERGSLEQLFANKRILMLHSGGDSRRLPMYAVTGKLFATLPLPMPGFRCGTVFDLMLDDLLALRPRVGGEVLISAGDAVLGIARAPIRFGGEGIIGVAQRASEVRASRHGVFAREGRSRIVRAFLQKPTHDELGRSRSRRQRTHRHWTHVLRSACNSRAVAWLRSCSEREREREEGLRRRQCARRHHARRACADRFVSRTYVRASTKHDARTVSRARCALVAQRACAAVRGDARNTVFR